MLPKDSFHLTISAIANGISKKKNLINQFNRDPLIIVEDKEFITIEWGLLDSVMDNVREHFGSGIISWVFSDYREHKATLNSYFAFELYNMLNILMSENIDRYKCTLLASELLKATWLYTAMAPGPTKNIDIPRIAKNMTWPPLPHQNEFFTHYRDTVTKFGFNGGLIAFSMGGGKALDLDEPIFTGRGWVKAGDVTKDDRFFGSDGKPRKLEGIFPQGVTKREKVTFKDGTIINCNPEHLWRVNAYDQLDENKFIDSLVMSTEDIKKTKNVTFHVPIAEPHVGLFDHDLPMEPKYLAGVLQQATTSDVGIHMNTALEKLGLDLHAGYLVIPSLYLYHTIETRRALWEAFLSGTTKEGEEELPTTLRFESESLCSSFMELSQGLGIPCSYRSVSVDIITETRDTSIIVDGKVNEEDLVDGELPIIEVMDNTNYYVIEFHPKDGKKIVAIESIEDKETVCFSIEGEDKLFMCRNYTLTHNTYTALGLAEGLNADRIIVVCPKVAIADPWIDNGSKLFREPRKIWSSLEKGNPPKDAFLVIMNYEGTKKYITELMTHKKKRVLIVLDESHNLNSMESNRTVEFLQLVKAMNGHTVFLSGTPIKAVQSEVLTLMTAIDKKFKDDIPERFSGVYRNGTYITLNLLSYRINASSYIVEKKDIGLGPHQAENMYLTVPNGHRYTLEYISKKMKQYADRRLKVLNKSRPKKTKRYFKLIELVKVTRFKGYKEFKEAVTDIMANDSYFHLKIEMKLVNKFEKEVIIPKLKKKGLHNEFKAIRSIAKYPKLKVLGETLGRVLGGYRIEAATALASAIPHKEIIGSAKKKTLYFTNSVQVVEQVIKDTSKDYNPVPVYGEHTKDMKTLVNRINKDPDANPIVATFMSLSTAVPLPIVSTVVVIDSPFRAYVLNQAIARAHRLGQDSKVTTIYCRLDTGKEKNVLERSLDLAKWSSATSSYILGVEDPIDFGIDREEVAEVVKHYHITLEDLELDFPKGSMF